MAVVRDGRRSSGGTLDVDVDTPPHAWIDDRRSRLLVNPLFAITIPNVAGLIDNGAYSYAGLAASYLWFLAMSTTVWEVTRRLYFARVDFSAWLSRPIERITALGAVIGLGTVPIIACGSLFWAWMAADPAATWRSVLLTTLVATGSVVIVVYVYETTFLIREWESDRLRSGRLEREKMTAELEALQREVTPHALFNMLNALVALIEQRSDDAVRFAEALAQAYRRMLRVRRQALVPLAEELELLNAFVALHELRSPGAVRVHLSLDDIGGLTVPPMVLPELLENAVKHNRASATRPLDVTLRRDGDSLIVSNPLRPISAAESGSVGLRNLDARCRLTTGRGVERADRAQHYEVRVPLVIV